MEPIYAELTARALSKHHSLKTAGSSSPQRTIIALAGPPGSGKSTVASIVAARINADLRIPNFATVVPMDGFHLPRSALDQLPNRAEAYARRGAAWTFDAQGVVDLVHALHASKMDTKQVILAPSFDHVLKDPQLNGVSIGSEVSIVILEGNWLLFDEEPWSSIARLVDDSWFVDVEPKLAKERIAKRHLRSGIEVTWEAALRRAEGNDLRNGDEVRRRLVSPGLRVMSIEVADRNP